jgi:hypothetical protein
MPSPLFKSPDKLVKEWPEVFDDLYMNTMPIAYVENLRLEFNSGRLWEINVKEQLNDFSSDIVIEKILNTFNEYQNEIIKVDFSIDIEKLKSDIKDQSKNFL